MSKITAQMDSGQRLWNNPYVDLLEWNSKRDDKSFLQKCGLKI